MNPPPRRPYQQEGIDLISQGFIGGDRAWILADETGLGKSNQALGVAERVMEDNIARGATWKRVVLMCPPMLKGNWIDEINKWLPPKKSGRGWSIIIKTYTGVITPEILHHLTRYKYDLLILDEFHYLKTFESQRTLAVLGAPAAQHKPLIKVCRQVLGLSATPIPQRVGEIYPWLWATKDPILNGLTYEDFVAKWAKSFNQTKFGLSHKGIKNAAKLKRDLGARMIRRKKTEVLKDLPPATRQYIDIPVSLKIYKEEAALLAELLEMSGHKNYQVAQLMRNPAVLQSILESVPSFEKLSLFKKQQGLFKIKAVMKYLEESVIQEKQKFILFTYHQDVAHKYAELLTKKGLPVTTITGETDVNDRLDMIKKANGEEKRILVATMGAIREGFNVTGFDTTYFAEIDWKSYALTQVEGRTHRFGQKNPVFWYYFLFDKGIERSIFNSVQEKNDTVKQIVE